MLKLKKYIHIIIPSLSVKTPCNAQWAEKEVKICHWTHA